MILGKGKLYKINYKNIFTGTEFSYPVFLNGAFYVRYCNPYFWGEKDVFLYIGKRKMHERDKLEMYTFLYKNMTIFFQTSYKELKIENVFEEIN